MGNKNSILKYANQLQNDIVGYIPARVLMLAAKQNLQDHLNDVPLSIDTLAKQLGYHPKAALRFFRFLESLGVVNIISDNHIKATPITPFLKKLKSAHFYDSYVAFNHFEKSLATNQECWSETFGKTFYPYLLDNPEKLSELETYCTLTGNDWLPSILTLHDFSQYPVIVDIGGGEGYLLSKIIAENTLQKGILFEKDEVISKLKTRFGKNSINLRIELVGGDFFKSIPADGDGYILCRILLNWSDEDAIKIINVCLSAMHKNAKLIIVDFIVPEKNHPHYHRALLHDLNLLAIFSSGLRTEKQWISLIKKTDCSITNIVITDDTTVPEPNVPMAVIVCSKN